MSESTLNIESEEFMTLLGEALRAGPASPQWHQAVGILRAHGGESDEYQMLCAARERLESGKEYRSLRAGPGFGKKVMEGIDRQPQRLRRPTTLMLVVGAAALTILGVLAVVIYRSLPRVVQQHKIDELTNPYYAHDVQAARFESGIPEGWQSLGELPVAVQNKELRLAAGNPTTTSTSVLAGGLICTTPLAADGFFSVTAVFRFAHAADETGTVRLFISDQPIASGHPSGEHELVCQLKNGEMRVALPGSESVRPELDQAGNLREIAVRILINRDLAVVDGPVKRLYAGANGLAPDKPRYVGIEFLRRSGEKWGRLGVASIVIQKP